jgi:uncharacterized RDD family membrane protein YckC
MNSKSKEPSLVEQYLSQSKSDDQIQINTTPSPKELQKAPLIKRTAAFVLDKISITIIAKYILSPLLQGLIDEVYLPFLIGLLVEFIYAGFFYSLYLATPGKIIFKLQVLNNSDMKLNFIDAGLRDSLGKLISTLIFGIGFLIAFFRPDRRSLHDIVFKTKVIIKI